MIIKTKGRILFHAIIINRSYRSRGYDPRIQINKIENKILLIDKKFPLPINIKEEKYLKNKIIPYSEIKIKEKKPPLYSVLKPETNSDSPSEKSKGVRLVSAKQINNQINNNIKFHKKK